MKVNINYICYLIIFVAFGFIYRRYMDKYDMLNSEKEEILIQKYLLTDNKFKNNKPFLWIHVPYEINSRSWESFKSRQNTNLNLPYMYLTIKSIIKHCGDSFNICLIDDKFHEDEKRYLSSTSIKEKFLQFGQEIENLKKKILELWQTQLKKR